MPDRSKTTIDTIHSAVHSAIDCATRCPLCDADNQCAVAAGKTIEQCWCNGAAMPADTLSRIPAEARGRACICPQCGTQRSEQ